MAEQTASVSVGFSGWTRASPPEHTALCTPELASVFNDAAVIGRSFDSAIDITYFSLVIALLRGDGEWSNWFAQLFGPDAIDRVLRADKRTSVPSLAESLATAAPGNVRLTASAQALFGVSFKNLGDFVVPNEAIDVRHVIGLYLIAPSGHEQQWIAIGVTPERRVRWLWTFIRRLRRTHRAEADRWIARAARDGIVEPTFAVLPYVTADGWTIVDTLGYERYYTALTDFIKDARTTAPLCISIQAPWGGGKTSLMRMIQAQLDREAVRLDNPVAVRALEAAEANAAPKPDDNASVHQLKADAGEPAGELTIGELLKAFREWTRSPGQKIDHPLKHETKPEASMTIWFNAWKYDGTNQVWAGLADTIIKQITRRMDVKSRELFFAQLTFARLDGDKIRAKVYDRIYRRAIGKIVPVAVGWSAAALAGIAAWIESAVIRHATEHAAGGAVAIAFVVVVLGALHSRLAYVRAEKSVTEEKAASTLTDVLSMPSYETEIGFVHKVDADLRRVLATVPDRYWPIVIFIDDLDRCSPGKVAQLMEAVNLFLAGDFARCIFVMGMDTEMVAASLDVAHKEVVDSLPQDSRLPVGWRFMDKFVQLPFVIPPIDTLDAAALTNGSPPVSAAAAQPAAAGANAAAASAPAGAASGATDAAAGTAETGAPTAQKIAIAQFDENDPEVRTMILRGIQHFAGNPREASAS